MRFFVLFFAFMVSYFYVSGQEVNADSLLLLNVTNEFALIDTNMVIKNIGDNVAVAGHAGHQYFPPINFNRRELSSKSISSFLSDIHGMKSNMDNLNRRLSWLDRISFSGLVDAFYIYDFALPANHVRQPFFSVYNRANEVNLNLALFSIAYRDDRARATVSFMAGTYANDNLISTPYTSKNIYEASIGFKITKKKNIWIDAGVFSSHIGLESPLNQYNWTLTRSILADNVPYFEAGAKVTYQSPNNKWQIQGLWLNGWQQIYKNIGSQLPSFGHAITFTPSSKITFCSSSFLGTIGADSSFRALHDAYMIYQIFPKWGLIIEHMVGDNANMKDYSKNSFFQAVTIINRYVLTHKWAMATRLEYVHDKNNTFIPVAQSTSNGFQVWGCSFNTDYYICKNIMYRMEVRYLNSKDKIFVLNNEPSNSNVFLSSALIAFF